MDYEQEETLPVGEQWMSTMEAVARYDVAPATLYRMAYADPPQLEYRVVTKGRFRPMMLYRRSQLDAWNATRAPKRRRKDSVAT